MNAGNEHVRREDVERMHREMGAFLQEEVDRGEEGPGLVEAGFHEQEIPEPSVPVEQPEDDIEERAKAALSAGQTLIEHEARSDSDDLGSRESAWTDRARKLYEQGEINSTQADEMSGLNPGHERDS